MAKAEAKADQKDEQAKGAKGAKGNAAPKAGGAKAGSESKGGEAKGGEAKKTGGLFTSKKAAEKKARDKEKGEEQKKEEASNEQIYTALLKLAKTGTLRLKDGEKWTMFYFMTKGRNFVWYKVRPQGFHAIAPTVDLLYLFKQDKDDETKDTFAQPTWIGKNDFKDMKDVILDGGGVFRARFIIKKRPKLITLKADSEEEAKKWRHCLRIYQAACKNLVDDEKEMEAAMSKVDFLKGWLHLGTIVETKGKMFSKTRVKYSFEQFFFVLRIGRLLWFAIPEDDEMPTAAMLQDDMAKGSLIMKSESTIEKTELGQVLNVFNMTTPGTALDDGKGSDQVAYVAFSNAAQLKVWIDSIGALLEGKEIKPQAMEVEDGEKKKGKKKEKKEEKEEKKEEKQESLIDLGEMNLSAMSLPQLQAALVLKGRKKEDVESKATDAQSAIALLLYAMSEVEIEKKIENLQLTDELKDVEKTARRMKVLEKVILEGDVGDNEEISRKHRERIGQGPAKVKRAPPKIDRCLAVNCGVWPPVLGQIVEVRKGITNAVYNTLRPRGNINPADLKREQHPWLAGQVSAMHGAHEKPPKQKDRNNRGKFIERIDRKALRFDILENAGSSDFYRVYQEDQSVVLQGKERYVEIDVLRPLGGKMQCENLVLELFYRRNIMEPGCVLPPMTRIAFLLCLPCARVRRVP
jgi:hypothetical protein